MKDRKLQDAKVQPKPQPKPHPAVSPPPRVYLRRPITADLERLVQVERACFASPWPTASLAAELSHADALLVLAESRDGDSDRDPVDGDDPSSTDHESPRPVGYAAYRAAAGEAELLRLAVIPAARRQGVASALLAAGDEGLTAADAEICYLEVRASNRSAQAFYFQAGFHRIGHRPRYYPDGDDALLLARAVRPTVPR